MSAVRTADGIEKRLLSGIPGRISGGREQKQPLSEQIHDAVLEMVIRLSDDGEADTVFTESALVEQFGVSKAPVREALVKLCGEGVLRSMPRFGYTIVRLGVREARDITSFRLILELGALRRSLPELPDAALERVGEHLAASHSRQEAQDVWSIWDDNMEFHCLLAGLDGNDYIPRALRESMMIQKRIYAQMHWQSQHTLENRLNPVPHERIYQAMLRRDVEAAVEALRQDIAEGTQEDE